MLININDCCFTVVFSCYCNLVQQALLACLSHAQHFPRRCRRHQPNGRCVLSAVEKEKILFMDQLLCVRHCAGHFTSIISLNSFSDMTGVIVYFLQEETDQENYNKLPNVKKLISDWIGVWSHVSLFDSRAHHSFIHPPMWLIFTEYLLSARSCSRPGSYRAVRQDSRVQQRVVSREPRMLSSGACWWPSPAGFWTHRKVGNEFTCGEWAGRRRGSGGSRRLDVLEEGVLEEGGVTNQDTLEALCREHFTEPCECKAALLTLHASLQAPLSNIPRFHTWGELHPCEDFAVDLRR